MKDIIGRVTRRIVAATDDENRLKSMKQWTTGDGTEFRPAGNTMAALPPGYYECNFSPMCGYFLSRVPCNTEDLIRFPETSVSSVVNEIKKFWTKEPEFRRAGLSFKRGLLMFGPPGTGKSCGIKLAITDVYERGGVAIKMEDPDIFRECVRIFRAIQPVTPLVVIMEDLDSLLERFSQTSILNLLDGVEGLEWCVFLATCFTPDTRFLTSDLKWVPCGELKVGDELLAFDEARPKGKGSRRRFRKSVVTRSHPAKKECVRVTLNTGESYTCTTDHPWLTYGPHNSGHSERTMWTQAKDLMSHPRLVRPFKPWETDTSWDAGWLAGMLDGEGNVSGGKNGRNSCVTVAQNDGPAAEKLATEIVKRVDAHVYHRTGKRKKQQIIDTRGGVASSASLIGQVRALRLISNFSIEGGMMHNKFPAEVVSVEPVGVVDIQSIETSTGTYIAEGFACHNTNYPEKLGSRIINRPSRFDRRFEVPALGTKSRAIYLQHLISKYRPDREIDLERWVEDTEGMSISHLKELFVGVLILEDDYEQVMEMLQNMQTEHPVSGEVLPSSIGQEGQRMEKTAPPLACCGSDYSRIVEVADSIR